MTDTRLPSGLRSESRSIFAGQEAAGATPNALLQYLAKLERRSPLPPRERDAVLGLRGTRQDYAPNQTLIGLGDKATHCVIVEKGLVSRIKTLEDGSRQIVAFHIPGDAVDLQSILFTNSDHDIIAHSPTRTLWVPHEDILALAADHPVLGRALWLDTLVDAAIFREWTVNVGQRNARERIGHLFLEMAARLEAIGLLHDNSFDLPVTQSNLAEALGLSLVHMNKSLQALRREGYLTIKERRVVLLKRAELMAFSGFNDCYLHLDGTRSKEVAASRNGSVFAERSVAG